MKRIGKERDTSKADFATLVCNRGGQKGVSFRPNAVSGTVRQPNQQWIGNALFNAAVSNEMKNKRWARF